MSPAVKRRKASPSIAQASTDTTLATTRAHVLQGSGYEVRNFMSPDELLHACRKEKFDLLLIGHLLEHVEREQMSFIFRTYNAGSPIVQLQSVETVPTTADFSFNVENGPEALVHLLSEIVRGKRLSARVGD